MFKVKIEFTHAAMSICHCTFCSSKKSSNSDEFVLIVHKAHCVNSLVFSGEQILISVAQLARNSVFESILWKSPNRHVIRCAIQRKPSLCPALLKLKYASVSIFSKMPAPEYILSPLCQLNEKKKKNRKKCLKH